MVKSFSAGAVLVLLALSLAAGGASSQEDRSDASVAGVERPAPSNAAGQPVRTAYGAAINYRKNEWQEAEPFSGMAAAVSLAPQASPLRLATPALADWSYGALGTRIGDSGLLTVTNGTRTEIYAAGGVDFGENFYWYALRYSRNTNTFQQLYVSEKFPQYIRALALARVAGRSSPLLIVALGDGTIRQYDQVTKALLTSESGPCTSHGGLQTLITADLNGDGTDEFVSSCEDKTLAAYGKDYTAWTLERVGGVELAAGQMDDDPALEIASNTGHVIDTGAKAVQWKSPSGAHLQVVDIDADGRDELITAVDWYKVRAFDVERKLAKWSLATDDEVAAVRVADIDGDRVNELLLGDGQWGHIHAYNTRTLAEEWFITNPEHGVTNIAVADIDADGVAEVLWGTGATSTGPDYLFAGDWHSRSIMAQTEHLDGPFIGPQVGDLDGDGVAEIVVASFTSEAGRDSGRIVVIDSRSRQVRAISPSIAGARYGFTGVHDIKLRDLDGNGRPEILVAADWGFDGLIEAYSFSAANEFALVWTNASRPEDAPFHAVDVADIDGDGTLEVLAGSSSDRPGEYGVFIYAYDVATGAEEWHTQQLGSVISAVTDLVIADTDSDGDQDFCGMVENDYVYVFDGPTHQLEAIIPIASASLTTKGGKAPKLMVGSNSGRKSLHASDGTGFPGGYPEISGITYSSDALDGLHHQPIGSLWVGAGGKLERYKKGNITFSTANYGTRFGSELATVPGQEWVYSAGGHGVHGFKTKP